MKLGLRRTMISFKDLDNQEIMVSISENSSYKVYISTNEDKKQCLHLSKSKAFLLIHALKDLINEGED